MPTGNEQVPRSVTGRILMAVIAPFALIAHPFVPSRLRPGLAAFLCLLCPGLGHWYIGQGGIFAFYLSVELAVAAGACDLLRRWKPDSVFSERWLTWGILGIVIGGLVWAVSILDAWLRTKRMAQSGWTPHQTRRFTAGLLSLLVPGIGQAYSRRFLMGIWTMLLMTFLILAAWSVFPHREYSYYAQFTSDPMSRADVYWFNHDLGIRFAWIAAVLWIANVIDAAAHAGQQCVLPEAVVKFITPGRMKEAWPEFVYALGFLAAEYHALDSWGKEPVLLIDYLKYWVMYESLSVIALIIGLIVIARRKMRDYEQHSVINLIALAVLSAVLLLKSEEFSAGWLVLTFAVVAVPRWIHIIVEKPTIQEVLARIGLAFKCLAFATVLLIPIVLFWKIINPWYYEHLMRTRCLYVLGFLFYLILGFLELVKARPAKTAVLVVHSGGVRAAHEK